MVSKVHVLSLKWQCFNFQADLELHFFKYSLGHVFSTLMHGSSHIGSVLIRVEYQNCRQTLPPLLC